MRPFILGRLDRYLLALTITPMLAVVGSTMVAFLMERVLRSADLLAQTNRGMEFLSELIVNLAPHYLGLVLPSGFFFGLFVVISRLNRGSEIDAILSTGVSLSRFAMPFVGLGVAVMAFSLILYGFVQPYSRYTYHAVLHAAENAGWNGEVRPQALISPTPDMAFTADSADPTGRRLRGVFLRRVASNGEEVVITASTATVQRESEDGMVTLSLVDGRQMITPATGESQFLAFGRFAVRLPMAPNGGRMRGRGGEESELTLGELLTEAVSPTPPMLPRAKLLAEFYARIARSISLPLMPLLAIPFGMTTKRSGAAPAIGVGAIILFCFQTALIGGQAVAGTGAIPAAVAVGAPTAMFAGACIATFALSRRRPGENPVNWLTERVADLIAALLRRRAPPGRPTPRLA